MESFIKHVEEYKQYTDMKIAVANIKAKLASMKPATVENMRLEESPEEPNLEELGEDLEPAVDQTYHDDEEEATEYKFIKGNKGSKNPGKLIFGNRQQFICNKQKKLEKEQDAFISAQESMKVEVKEKEQHCKTLC